MATIENGCSASTTFVWKKVRMSTPPQAQGTARAKRARLGAAVGTQRPATTDYRGPKHVQVRARGGAELWWEITWGGVTKRFPGHVQLQDAMLCVLTHGSSCRGHREERFGQ